MNMTNNSNRQTNRSSIRLLQILECLAQERAPMRLQDISKQVGMTQSTVSRYLYALQEENYVYQESETSRYALTWRICGLCENLSTPLSLRSISASFINHLAITLSLGACLVVDKDSECMYLDCIDNPRFPTLQHIGKRASLHATGSGKVLLSQYSETQLSTYIQTKGLIRYTEHTITDPAALYKELSDVRQKGFALDMEECENGLYCLSVPLRDYSKRIVAAISLFGNADDLSKEKMTDNLYPILKETAALISIRLGYPLID